MLRFVEKVVRGQWMPASTLWCETIRNPRTVVLRYPASTRSLAFSATAMVAALVIACGIPGNTEASMTRRPAEASLAEAQLLRVNEDRSTRLDQGGLEDVETSRHRFRAQEEQSDDSANKRDDAADRKSEAVAFYHRSRAFDDASHEEGRQDSGRSANGAVDTEHRAALAWRCGLREDCRGQGIDDRRQGTPIKTRTIFNVMLAA